ncbi:hypothetical protein MZE56_024175 [Rahnella perminowiae]|nr:hypothetical protein [Rahnella perminowiae]MCR9003092.1 hypothetical protein [Rahnella perminowiae]
MIGMLLAGAVYWGCTVAVLKFHAWGEGREAGASLPGIVVQLFGQKHCGSPASLATWHVLPA